MVLRINLGVFPRVLMTDHTPCITGHTVFVSVVALLGMRLLVASRWLRLLRNLHLGRLLAITLALVREIIHLQPNPIK